jgi:hypothetical protein
MNFESEHLQYVFVKGDTLLVGSLFTIYRSTDKGESWTNSEDLVPASFVSIFEYKNEFFAAQDRYIYRSSDGGVTWKKVFTTSNGYAAVVATDSFLLAFYTDKSRLVRSIDGFRSWKTIDTDTLNIHLEEDPYGGYPFKWIGGTGKMLYYFQTGDSHYFCPIRYCYSSDGGTTWMRGNNGMQLPIGRRLNDGINFGQHILIGSDLIQHSVDSARTFFPLQKGLSSASVWQILHQKKKAILTLSPGENHLSSDLGESWETEPLQDSLDNNCQQRVWLRKTNNRIFRRRDLYFEYTEDGGHNWVGLDVESSSHWFTTENAFFIRETKWTPAGVVDKIWKLDDENTAFVEIELSGFDLFNYSYTYFYGYGDRFGVELDSFYVFDENGILIRNLPTIPCKAMLFGDLGNLYFDGNTYYNFCNDRAYILPPNAVDWQEIYPQDWTTGIPLYHSPMTFFEPHDGVIWVGLEGKGLFYATDNTGRFYPAQPQMPYPYPTSISFVENSIWVGTDGGGIWTYPLPKTRNDQADNPGFKAFPNPSNGALNLQSELFVKGEIAFSLLDAAGRQMATETLTPGQYWSLDFPGLPKGLYFLQMRTESGVYGLKWLILN